MTSLLDHALFAATANDVDDPVRARPAGYAPAQLHERSERCWAVVGEPDGAIAENAEGRLIMRLTRDEARLVASAMNAALVCGSRAAPGPSAARLSLVPA